MGNENIDNQAQDLVEAAGSEPKDLAEAYAAIRNQNAQVAQEPVGAGEDGSQQQPQQQQQPAGTGEGNNSGDSSQQAASPATVPATTQVDQTSGGSADSSQGGYYSNKAKSLTKSIHDAAARQAIREMQEAKVDKASFADITQKDEKTGEIKFINPDNNRPFESRQAAGAWISEYNKSVDEFFQMRASEIQRQALNNASNLIALYNFEDRMTKMDDDTLEVFGDLIEPYAVYTKDGSFAGYSCNLEAAARQAESMTSKYRSRWNTPAEGQQKVNNVKQPAVAMNTGGSSSQGDSEPKTLEEAMKMLNEKKRSK